MKNILLRIAVVLALVAISVSPSWAEDGKLSYCNGEGSDEGLGNSNFQKVSAAARFDADATDIFAGGSITSVRCYIASTTNMTSLNVWVKRHLDDDDCLASVSVWFPEKGWNSVMLSDPLPLNRGDEVVLGYTYTQSGPCYPLAFSDYMTAGGAYLDSGNGYYDYSGDFGALCIEATVKDVPVTGYGVRLRALQTSASYHKVGDDLPLTLSFQNTGKAFSSLGMKISVDGQEPIRHTVNGEAAFSETKTLSLSVPTPQKVNASCRVAVSVESIDGEACSDTGGGEVSAVMGFFDKFYDRNVLIEEGTGTWCGWCVRGMVAMEEMRTKHPDTFIGIAVHSGDKMAIESYPANVSGFPCCNVDRTIWDQSVSPSYFETLYNRERQRLTYADFSLSGYIDNGVVHALTNTTFDFDNPDADYRVVYVVKEDGVTGYPQQNYYAGGGNGEMGGFESRPSVVSDLEFNDVARLIYPSYWGERGSLPAIITANKRYSNGASFELPATLQDEGRLTLVAMLLDGRSGEVIQAHQLALAHDTAPDAISSTVVSAPAVQTRYAVDGRQLTAPSRGISIVRTSDGRVRKVCR